MKRAGQFVRVISLAANVLFGVITWAFCFDASCTYPVTLAIIVGVYVSSNSGAMIASSRRWRIIWTIPAILANAAVAWYAISLAIDSFDRSSPARMFVKVIYVCAVLVTLNVLGILSKGKLPLRRQAPHDSV